MNLSTIQNYPYHSYPVWTWPEEITLKIFTELDPYSLAKAARVCKFFLRIYHDETIWKQKMIEELKNQNLIQHHFIEVFKSWKKAYHNFLKMREQGIVLSATQVQKAADLYHGVFENGRLNGPGKIIKQNGVICEGYFQNDELMGLGKMILSNGNTIEGLFKNQEMTCLKVLANSNTYLSFYPHQSYLNDWKTFTYTHVIFSNHEIWNGRIKMINDRETLIKGTKILTNRNIYKGFFKNNALEGYARTVDATGKIALGKFKKGYLIKGKLISSNGNIQLVNLDLPLRNPPLNQPSSNGHAKWIDSNGNFYKGSFENGKLHGKGLIVFINGDIWKGFFDCGYLYKGTKIFANGMIWSGKFNHEKLYGRGAIIFPDNKKFIGDFEEGCLKNGQIIYNYGDMFKGRFQDGSLNGEGEILLLYNCITQIIKGKFHENQLTNGTFQFVSGETWKGQFINNQLNEKNQVIFSNGTIWKGVFKNHLLNGYGKIIFNHGEVITGVFENHKLHQGTIFAANQDTWPATLKDYLADNQFMVISPDGKKRQIRNSH